MEILQLSDYTIYLGDHWEALNNFYREAAYSRLLVLVDEHTEVHCLPLFRDHLMRKDLSLIRVPAGERHKNIATCGLIWEQMMKIEADRRSLMINLGGGVIGDMGGFCAGTFKRGIDFVQIPTTLLSQVDASIGGKLGIDFMQVKNSIGLFRNPQAVFIFPEFLNTLPEREIRSGFAEIVKHALIASSEQWENIKNLESLKEPDWPDLIVPSLHIKKEIVEKDPMEKGLRKALNFGHTVGHAIEGKLLETASPLLHGEAVAAGMICESYLSHRVLGLPQQHREEISSFLLKIYQLPKLNPKEFPGFIELMRSDKKNEGGRINFSLLPAPGLVAINQYCGEDLILESLKYYNDLVG